MKNLLITTALATSLAGPSLAQTLAETLEMGIGFMESDAGLTIGSRETTDDGSVILRDVRMAPDGDDDVTLTTPEITFSPDGDTPGGVVVTTDLITITDPDAETPLEVSIAGENFSIVTNWMQAMAMNPSVRITADSLSVTGGNENHPMLKALDVAADGLEITFDGSMFARSASGGLSVGTLSADYRITDPNLDSDQDVSFTYEGYEIAFSGENLPMDEDQIPQFIDEDGAFSVTASQGGTAFDMRIVTEGIPVNVSGSGGPGGGEISLLDGHFTYNAAAEGMAVDIELDPMVMPLPPFSVTMSELLMDINGPVRVTEGPEDLVVKLRLAELVVSDALWGIIDPEAQIPRDPATLDIDLGARVDIDMPLVEAMDEDGEGDADSPLMLGTVERVDVSRIFLTVGGAMVEAIGGIDVVYEGPFPVPDGVIDVTIEGVQTLATTIGELGLVPPEEIAPMMGMMMIFAAPGDAPDTFTSKIELSPDGVTANGVPLQ